MRVKTENFADYITAAIFVLALIVMIGTVVFAVSKNRESTVILCRDSRFQAQIDISQDERLTSLLRSAVLASDNPVFIADSKDAILEMQVEVRRLSKDAEKDC